MCWQLRDHSIGHIPDWIWSCADEWRGCNALLRGMHMAICTCYAQALILKLMGTMLHALILTVGSNELTYVHQFCTFCLGKKSLKFKWPPYKCETISVYCRSPWLAQDIAHSLTGEGDCKTCE